MFTRLIQLIRQVIHKMIPYKNVESAAGIESPISTDMMNALNNWHDAYVGRPPWIDHDEGVESLGIAAFICSEIARQITLEMKFAITPLDGQPDEDGVIAPSERTEFLTAAFQKLVDTLRPQLEKGCAAGGMTIKPYVRDGQIYFDLSPDWAFYPVSFDDEGNISDVIFRDSFVEGKTFYTRLERHRVNGDSVEITQRAFRSTSRDSIGSEISLTSVPIWAELAPEATVTNTDGALFGWYKVASANNEDVESPLGVSVFARAYDLIRDADEQYGRLKWEYEGSELALDVDDSVLRPKKRGVGLEMPKKRKRLFRGLDLGKEETYQIFSPAIRDASLVNGLNQIYRRIEDNCGLSRGMLSDTNTETRTATELVINKQRYYATVSENQKSLEKCLRDVIRVMDKYATIYGLAPEGEFDVSFEWDDSIITDTNQQLTERLALLNAGVTDAVELRMWYYGETREQAQNAVDQIEQRKMDAMKFVPGIEPEGD